MNEFDKAIAETSPEGLHAENSIDTIQINIGLVCNLACLHCHVESSPKRTEAMDWEVLEAVLKTAKETKAKTIDITGGAPEMNPHFKSFIKAARKQDHKVMVRTNLTILLEEDYKDYAEFMKNHQVELVASLPCYLETNVDKQRGKGVYNKSIDVIKKLNELGYGIEPNLPLTLVYNPIGPSLPPSQQNLQSDYQRELKRLFNISFTQLYTITNMPIGRFQRDLARQGKDKDYLQLLREAYNPETVDGLMCRHQINVSWDGTLYDCDFNYAMKMPMNHGASNNIKSLDLSTILNRRIMTGNHCFGCTAGSGSSCGGELTQTSN